jgi:hypothetical protein
MIIYIAVIASLLAALALIEVPAYLNKKRKEKRYNDYKNTRK